MSQKECLLSELHVSSRGGEKGVREAGRGPACWELSPSGTHQPWPRATAPELLQSTWGSGPPPLGAPGLRKDVLLLALPVGV